MKLYIAVKTEFPDYMTPTLVAHAVLAAHKKFEHNADYNHWFTHSFKKCVVRVNSKEWEHVLNLPLVHLQQETKHLEGLQRVLWFALHLKYRTFLNLPTYGNRYD